MFKETPRPAAEGVDVTTTLRDFAIISYRVNTRALKALLPAAFEPEIFAFSDGSEGSLVSAVPFRDVDFTVACFPWIRFAFGQINYRAYVRYRGERAVWFFGTMLGSPLVAIPRYGWRLPWHRAEIQVSSQWDHGICNLYALNASGTWGEASVRYMGRSARMGTLDGFSDIDTCRAVLTHPLRGYYYRSDGQIGTYEIWHAKLEMTSIANPAARFSVFEDLGLTTPGQPAHSMLVQQETEFIIKLPPAVIGE